MLKQLFSTYFAEQDSGESAPEEIHPEDIHFSSPVLIDGGEMKRDSPEFKSGRRNAIYGLRVGSEAIHLDTVEQDYVSAYLYYCSAIKILMNALKGLFIHHLFFFFIFIFVCLYRTWLE